MGWWNHGEDGSSLHYEETGLIWGDSVADIVDETLYEIIDRFKDEWERKPTKKEIIAGIMFSHRFKELEE